MKVLDLLVMYLDPYSGANVCFGSGIKPEPDWTKINFIPCCKEAWDTFTEQMFVCLCHESEHSRASDSSTSGQSLHHEKEKSWEG